MSIVLSEPEVIVKVGPRQTSQTKQNAIQWQDEGSDLGNKEVDKIDFVGSGVAATRSGNKLTVTISSGGGASAWGGITGTLSDQTDLQAALDAKVPTSRTIASLALTGDITAAALRSALGGWTRVYVAGDITNNNATPDTLQDITGLKFPVTAGKKFAFWFFIRYESAATTTGSRWTINAVNTPANLTFTSYQITFSTGANAQAVQFRNGFDAGTVSTSSNSAGMICEIIGTVEMSAVDEIIGRFSSEVAGSAITVKGAFVEYVQLD